MNIVLIGYRGCGKTSVGKKLADQLWKEFVDVDHEVCRHFGDKSIREIWDKHGRKAFRDKECLVVSELLKKDNQVISLGGGTITPPEEHCPAHCDCHFLITKSENLVRIYLKCEPEELYRRLTRDESRAGSRPSHGKITLDMIKSDLVAREPVYESVADHVFDSTHTSTDETVRFLVQRFL